MPSCVFRDSIQEAERYKSKERMNNLDGKEVVRKSMLPLTNL